MTCEPDISVVMSVYNGAEHLGDSLDSVLSQADVSLELIAVNDGSTDSSSDMLMEYATRDRRVRVIHQENLGLTSALIRGCSEARGKYIARHDVGDVSHPRRLALQKAALDHDSDISFVSSWAEFCGPQWEFLYTYKGSGLAASPTYIISETEEYGVTDGPCHHGSVMYRKDCYEKCGGYRSEFYYGQDWDLWYRLGQLGKYQVIEQTLYKARVLPISISVENRSKQMALSKISLAAMRRRSQQMPEQDLLEKAARIIPGGVGKIGKRSRALGLYFIGECLRRNRDSRSVSYLMQSVQVQPYLLRSWIRIAQCKLRFGLHAPESLAGRSVPFAKMSDAWSQKQDRKD